MPPLFSDKQKISLKGRVKRYFLKLLRLTDRPVVKIHRSFGNDKHLIIYGHVFRQSARPRKKYRNIDLVNLLAVLRLFLVRPYPDALIRVCFGEESVQVQADQDGCFQVQLPLVKPLSPGWHRVRAQLVRRC